MRRLAAYNTIFVTLMAVFVLLAFWGVGTAVKNISAKEKNKKFQSIYANYSDALLKTVTQMGGNTGCYYTKSTEGEHDFSNCDEFYKTFVSNLKVQKYCHGNALADGCIPPYKSYITKEKCIGFSKEMMNEHDDAFVMLGGSSVIVFNVKKNDRRPIFAVDINGEANPNNAGEDLFSVTIMRNPHGAYYFHTNVSYCLPVEKGGIEYINDVYK